MGQERTGLTARLCLAKVGYFRPNRRSRACQLDPPRCYALNYLFDVIHFFDSMNFSFGPAATRWAALF
jgi:hypothetical protein